MHARIKDARQKPRDVKKYRSHIESLSKPPPDGSGVVLRALTTGAAAYASYFAVAKDRVTIGTRTTMTGRAIFDARFFNDLCKPPPGFGLGDVSTVMDVLSTFGTKKLFFFSADLVNMYYQVPIGGHLAIFMAILMNNVSFIPEVMPMGWSWSCFVAQSLTWGLECQIGSGVRRRCRDMSR